MLSALRKLHGGRTGSGGPAVGVKRSRAPKSDGQRTAADTPRHHRIGTGGARIAARTAADRPELKRGHALSLDGDLVTSMGPTARAATGPSRS